MRWGQLEFAGTGSDDATRDTVGRKAEKLRHAQQEGLLDPSWDPLDIVVFVNQLAMGWAEQPGLTSIESGARDQFLADRRAAIVAAVERLFPAVIPRPNRE